MKHKMYKDKGDVMNNLWPKGFQSTNGFLSGLIVLFLIAVNPIITAADSAPVKPVVDIADFRCGHSPVIDGSLGDKCWKNAYRSKTFFNFPLDPQKVIKNSDTTLLITCDDSWLYFGFKCKHPIPNDMTARIKENCAGRVFGDECIKLFIFPSGDKKRFFRFCLNFNNVYNFSEIVLGAKQMSLPMNMCWPSATKITSYGWSAEIAVPLFLITKNGSLADIKLNAFRKKLVNDYDQYHAIIGSSETLTSWSPASDWLNLGEFATIRSSKRLNPAVPFIAKADKVFAGDIQQEGTRFSYPVKLILEALTKKAGKVAVELEEKFPDGHKAIINKSFELAGKQTKNVYIKVPVAKFGSRKITIKLTNEKTGMQFQKINIITSGLDILKTFSRLNYYTNEKDALICYRIGLPEEKRKQICLIASDAKGNVLGKQQAPQDRGTFKLQLDNFSYGKHKITLRLIEGKKEIFQTHIQLEKYPVNLNGEWKIDRLTGCSLLYNGKPFFPFGVMADYNDGAYKEIHEVGLNTIIFWKTYDKIPDYRDVAELAKKYNLKLIVRPAAMLPNRGKELVLLKKHFTGKEYSAVLKYTRTLLKLKGGLMRASFDKLTRAQRTAVFSELLELYLPAILKRVELLMKYRNFLGYYTLDEPLLRRASLQIPLRKMYLEMRKIDPYHPVFALYSSIIPAGKEATCFADCLGTDPYLIIGSQTSPRATFNWVSKITARNVARAEAEGMCPFTVPMASFYSQTRKRLLTGQEQICQTYLAMIHGTKGIMYFTHWQVQTRKMWDAMKTLAHRIKILTPALTSRKTEQKITYKPGVWDPLKGKFPDVQACLFRFPGSGYYVLMAANIRRSPVELKITVNGLQDQQVSDLFDGLIGKAVKGNFKDIIGPRGVRTYLFKKISSAEPVKININIKPLGKEGDLESSCPLEGRKNNRNILPNSSFEQSTADAVPDYFWPRGAYRWWKVKLGDPNATAGLTSENPYHGKQCVFIGPPGAAAENVSVSWFFRLAPQHKTSQTYTLSFYARTDSGKPVALSVGSANCKVKNARRSGKRLMISGKKWKRYSVCFTVPRKVNKRNSQFYFSVSYKQSGRVYLDAVQFEKGDKPTDYTP